MDISAEHTPLNVLIILTDQLRADFVGYARQSKFATPTYPGPKLEWRLDPHPAWCLDGQHITFNAWHKNRRRVFLADLQGIDITTKFASV